MIWCRAAARQLDGGVGVGVDDVADDLGASGEAEAPEDADRVGVYRVGLRATAGHRDAGLGVGVDPVGEHSCIVGCGRAQPVPEQRVVRSHRARVHHDAEAIRRRPFP